MLNLQGDYYIIAENGGLKRPLSWLTGRPHDVKDTANWLSCDMAEFWATQWGARVGYVLAPECGYWCLDVDKRELSDPLSLELLGALSGCAVEMSQSGTGFHVWGRGAVPEHDKRDSSLKIELYHEKRYIALGQYLYGDCEHDATEQMAGVVERWFAPAAPVAVAEGGESVLSDAEVIAKGLMATENEGVLSFKQLWTMDFPDELKGDGSKIDNKMAYALAFWCRKDKAQIERLMREQWVGRHGREKKWNTHKTYLREITITNACAAQPRMYEPRGRAAAEGAVPKVGDFLNREAQAALFKDCVLVPSTLMAVTPYGIIGKEAFNLHFNRLKFGMDDKNEKVTDEAWKAFTQSQVFNAPKADGYCFKPLMAPCALVTRGGITNVNTYRRLEVPSVPGDVSIMLEHLEWMFPDAGDRAQILAYAAAVVQYQGHKFHWAPVFQGAQGNGKGMLAECLMEAIPALYVAKPAIDDITNKFNLWAEGKIFAFGDELHLQPHMMDRLKLLITSRTIEIEAKGKDKRTAEICVNFMFATNYRTAVPDAKNERRFAIYYSAQQDKEEIEVDGTSKRAARMWDWLIKEGGYARVTHYLQRYSIPDELNPAEGCRTAPRTSSYDEVCQWAKGEFGVLVDNAIHAGYLGITEDWISSKAMAAYLEEHKIRYNSRTFAAKLKELGYAKVTKGNVRAFDGAPTVLYYRGADSLMSQREDKNIREAFMKEAQAYVAHNN